MLVTYTLYQSLSTYLPQTSYMKMIDIWLFVGLIFPFLNVTILVIMDALIMKEKDEVIDIKLEGKIDINSDFRYIIVLKVSLVQLQGSAIRSSSRDKVSRAVLGREEII